MLTTLESYIFWTSAYLCLEESGHKTKRELAGPGLQWDFEPRFICIYRNIYKKSLRYQNNLL